MENVEILLDTLKFVITGLGILTGAITSYYGSKNKKAKKLADNLNTIRNYTQKFVMVAEDYIQFNGPTKKEWVVMKVNQKLKELEIDYNDDQVSNFIEEAVDLSKRVNLRLKKPTDNVSNKTI